MLTRRDFLQLAAATAAIGAGIGGFSRALAQQRLSQEDLLRFEPLGQVTLLHFTDIHAQLLPVHFREPEINLGVGEAKGLPPHVTGAQFLQRFGLQPSTAEAFALTHLDFAALAKSYGKIGGLDRMATVVKAIRAARPGRVLLLDGGDTWQGSYTSNQSRGADMVAAMNALGVEAMTAHWEFTYGADRVKELADTLKFPFLAGNVRDTEWNEDVFKATQVFERGGVTVAVIGQAFPYTPVANPRHLIPKWSFGIQEQRVQAHVDAARAGGADLVVLLSHNGFDVDRKMAVRVKGIDVILSGHTHDAVPAAIEVGKTLLIASGSHGKFLSRLDLEVKEKRVAGYRYRLIPLFADAIKPDPEMAALIAKIRAPHEAALKTVLGKTDSLLYRRGNFNGTFDDLICQALIAERDAEVALSPGFRWGVSVLPGADITAEDVYTQTAITYPNAYRTEMTGAYLKDVLEDVADNLFNPDPYYQQGGDMVRAGGLAYQIDINRPIGKRISNMTLGRTGKPIEPEKTYVVAGWASVNEGTQGPPIWDVVMRYIEKQKVVRIEPNRSIKVVGA
jgi:sulfur-oxidizing protein SoxB